MNTYRVYFNRKSEFPQVWSLDEGTQHSEVNIINFVIPQGCRSESRYNGEKPNEDSPVAWIEVQAIAFTIHDGIAYFIGDPFAHSSLP